MKTIKFIKISNANLAQALISRGFVPIKEQLGDLSVFSFTHNDVIEQAIDEIKRDGRFEEIEYICDDLVSI